MFSFHCSQCPRAFRLDKPSLCQIHLKVFLRSVYLFLHHENFRQSLGYPCSVFNLCRHTLMNMRSQSCSLLLRDILKSQNRNHSWFFHLNRPRAQRDHLHMQDLVNHRPANRVQIVVGVGWEGRTHQREVWACSGKIQRLSSPLLQQFSLRKPQSASDCWHVPTPYLQNGLRAKWLNENAGRLGFGEEFRKRDQW